MVTTLEKVLEEVGALMDAHRAECLWFIRADYYPATAADALRMLGHIERHGNRQTWQQARRLRTWLSQNSNAVSAG